MDTSAFELGMNLEAACIPGRRMQNREESIRREGQTAKERILKTPFVDWELLQTFSSLAVFKKEVLFLVESPLSRKNLLQLCFGDTIF